MASVQLNERVRNKIVTVSSKFHFEPLTEQFGNAYLPRNLTLLALSYLLNKNHLIVGDPGWGKTTSAKIIASVFSGVPYDIFDSVEMRGNPQAYEEKRIARPDYGTLSKEGKELVRWLGSIATPVIIGDEVNRFSYEMQDVLLQGIDTKRWNYLNSSYFSGLMPSFFTANYQDDGNGHLIPPLMDRMHIVTEQKVISVSPERYIAAERLRSAVLCDPKATTEALRALNEGGLDAFKAAMKANMLRNVEPITDEQKTDIQRQIAKVRITYRDDEIDKAVNDPLLFLLSFISEINYSVRYGSKRSMDPVSDDTHDQNHIGVNVLSSVSPRTQMAAIDYIKALAWLNGRDRATVDDVLFVLPHVIAHKMVFTDDYRNTHGNDIRDVMESLHLSRELIKTASAHYQESADDLKRLIYQLQKCVSEKDGVVKIDEGMLSKIESENYDQPLARQLIAEVRNQAKQPFGNITDIMVAPDGNVSGKV